MLRQGFRKSSAQNRGLGGDVRLKSGEPAAVPTAVGVQKTETWLGPSKPKTSFSTKIHYHALLRLEDVAIWIAAVAYVELLIPKLYFEAKTPVFTPFLYP